MSITTKGQLLVLASFFLFSPMAHAEDKLAVSPEAIQRYRGAAREFADVALEKGRDRFGETETPLFADGLHVDQLTPLHWKYRGEDWILCNMAAQQQLMRTLEAASVVTGEQKYIRAAEDAVAYFLDHAILPKSKLPSWGGHLGWDLIADKPIHGHQKMHEFQGSIAYYEMWFRLRPEQAQTALEAIWGAQVQDWNTLLMNRHGKIDASHKAKWNAEYQPVEDVPIVSPRYTSYVGAAQGLITAACALHEHQDHKHALTWARRMVELIARTRHPETGLGGNRYTARPPTGSHRGGDHTYAEFGDRFGKRFLDWNVIISDWTMHWMTHSRQQRYAMALMHLGENLGPDTEAGRFFIEQGAAEAAPIGPYAFDEQNNTILSVHIDGKPIPRDEWFADKPVHERYTPERLAPRPVDGWITWPHAMAYRLTKGKSHWDTLRIMLRNLRVGEIGEPDGVGRELDAQDAQADAHLLITLLELQQGTGDAAFLNAAATIADKILATRRNGLFPQNDAEYARLNAIEPLALLHLADRLAGNAERLPKLVPDFGYWFNRYDNAEKNTGPYGRLRDYYFYGYGK